MTDSAKTILVVEDDREIRDLAMAVLEEEGYCVLAAASGDEAHRMLLARPELSIDLLFTDVVMPGRLDGIDFASVARRLHPGLVVLFATGFANLVRPSRDRDLCGPVLGKPYRPAQLRRAVAAALKALT